MPPNDVRPANSPESSARSFGAVALACILAAIFFLSGLGNEPFADEYAYLTQAYFADLLASGKVDDPAWLEYPAYDLPPLPKYWIGLSLHAARIPIPKREAAFHWYRDINARFGSPEALTVARIPSTLLAVAGCLALFAIGRAAGNRRAGLIAYALLAINPLYGVLARRAMSDVPCEALGLAALALGLAAWIRAAASGGPTTWFWLASAFSGLCVGLALLCKFSALLVPMILAAWCLLAILLPGKSVAARISLPAGLLLAAAVASTTFVGLNPFMRTHPSQLLPPELAKVDAMNLLQRFQFQMDHRRTISDGQQQIFPHNALTTPLEKIKVVAVQGFGRFGPFGKQGWSSAEKTSERRYEWAQDWGAVIWGPLVMAGFVASCVLGWRQFRSRAVPTGWAVAVWAMVTFGVVTLYIPMAWDRYLLPLQAVSSLLVAMLASLIWDWATRSTRPVARSTEA